jgi:hypothetical protein
LESLDSGETISTPSSHEISGGVFPSFVCSTTTPGGNGRGGHLHIGSEVHEAHGSWEPHKRHGVASSTWQELSALLRLLRSFAPVVLQDCTVVARGDARNVFSTLQKGGSGREHLQTVCLDIFALCLEHRLNLRPEWLPRKENERADYLSKIRNVDDFGISPDVSLKSPQHSDHSPSIGSRAPTTLSCSVLTPSFGARALRW